MDLLPLQSWCFRKLCLAYSFKRSCFFLLLFAVISIVFLLVAALIIIFIIKPQKPGFSFETGSLDWYKLDAYSNSTLFLSAVIELAINASNPNKFNIWYRPSRLEAFYNGLPIGTIRIPGLLQPAHSSNVSVATRVLLPCLNVSQIVADASLEAETRKSMFQMEIVGDVGAHLWLLHIIVLKIKVAVECDLNIEYEELLVRNEVLSVGVVKENFVSFE